MRATCPAHLPLQFTYYQHLALRRYCDVLPTFGHYDTEPSWCLEAQSVYVFRGADIQNILHFASDYSNHIVIQLEQNYCSTKHIVDSVL
jgi:hypothetical protein